MKNIHYALILLTTFFITSCEKVVDVDLDTATPRLVVDASINWIKGTDGSVQKIKLSTTSGYYDESVPVVSRATVQITNTANTVFTFIETPGTGEYVCNEFIPVIGESYELTIFYDGETYTATETLIGTPVIEEVEQNDEGGFNGDEMEVKFYFRDNGVEDNFYMTSVATDITVFPDYDVFDDEFFQGNRIFGLYIHEDLKTGDQMQLSIYGISEQYHNYMNILLPISDGNGGPWQTPPTNVRGNLINQGNRDNFALGYFRLSEVDQLDYTVQ